MHEKYVRTSTYANDRSAHCSCREKLCDHHYLPDKNEQPCGWNTTPAPASRKTKKETATVDTRGEEKPKNQNAP